MFLLVAVRAAWFAVDPTPMLFLGDSQSYLATAVWRSIPPDRSFYYGDVVRLVAVSTGDLRWLLAFQAACSVVAALLLAGAIREVVGAKPILAGSLAVVWAACEPLAVLWERYVMAEACALPLFGVFILSGLRYVATRRIGWLALANVAGTGVLAFRLPFVAAAWIAAIVLPPLTLLARRRITVRKGIGELEPVAHRSDASGVPSAPAHRSQLWVLLAHLLLSIAIAAVLHAGYRARFAALAGGPPAYQRADGLFLVAAWAPLLEASDFPDPALGRDVLAASRCALRDRSARNDQRFSDGCLVWQLTAAIGDPIVTDDVARKTALALLRRDPSGVAFLALDTWLDYVNPTVLADVMKWDRQDLDYPEEVNRLLGERFGIDGRPLPHLSTASNRWYFRASFWLVVLAVSPALAWLAFLVRVVRGDDRVRQAAWIAIMATVLMVIPAAVGVRAAPRFLHPLGWLAPLWIAELIAIISAFFRLDHRGIHSGTIA